jgi:hypothetical protein
VTPELKAEIDAMGQLQMAAVWRFAKTGDPRLQGEAGDYFQRCFNKLGGFTPAISKAIGWG